MTQYRTKRQQSVIKIYFRRIMLVANIAFAIALILSYLANFVNPNTFYFVAFFGLLYPVWVILNLAMLTYWLFTIPVRALISILSIGLGFHYLVNFFTISFNDNSNSDKSNINVLSYNVRVFNRWNWVKNKNQGAEIIKFIKNSHANIVCLQEFYSDKAKHDNVAAIMNKSILKHADVSYNRKNNNTYKSGIAIFTSYPIVRKGKIGYNKNDNFCIFADVKIDSKIIRVYNIHLKSIRLGYSDYNFLKRLNNTDTIDVKSAKSIYTKMKRSYILRAKQADLIAQNIKNCNYPVILCGDFNDVPMSYAYHTIKHSLIDAFSKSGNGLGATYTKTLLPFRIDFILHSSSIQSIEYKTVELLLSDHYPVKSTLQFVQ